MSGQGFSSDGGNLDTQDFLHRIIKERFSDQTVVTASLMAPSVVVLKMVAGINPETPIIFCRRPPFFDESTEYRNRIVDLLGLKNVSTSEGHEAQTRPGDKDHCEYMWIQHRMPGRSFEILHLNESLAPYQCWISAVYHDTRPDRVRNLIEGDGLLTKVDPLIQWSKDDVRDFMSTHGLPYHKMAKRTQAVDKSERTEASPSYHY
ncbi:MAG: phosphoadenosine phosphosulfate reductase family protein [Geminicoccaceae bacterium]